MGITGTLTMGGSKFDVVSFSISFSRNVDFKGRPSSIVMGGVMEMSIEITAESKLVSQMLMKNEGVAGKLIFEKAGKDGEFRKVEFENSFITNYSEGFDVSSSTNFVCSVTISAEIVTIKSAKFDQRWPVES